MAREYKKIIASGITALLFYGAFVAHAYIASSTNYRIETDTISAGGIRSTSSNYTAQDTLGGIGTGTGTSTSYQILAGYQPMGEVYMAITSPSDASMSPSISSGSGVGKGATAWTATTDSPSGYTLTIRAGAAPAMTSSNDQFSDYSTESSGVPDYTWNISSGNSEFGFSPEGNDIIQSYKDNGSICNAGSSDTSERCWDRFTTANKTIASASVGNHPSGTATTIRFQSEIASSRSQKAGTYSADITATAVPQ